MAKSRENNRSITEEATVGKNYRRVINSAVSLGRSGLTGKACRMLLSSGIAPNSDTTWRLLQAKHPACPPPVTPNATSEPVTLGPTFNILKILRSFPKGIVNLMASGRVPVPVATFLAGSRLIALNKGKEGNPPDVRPIAVGETLRRLTGKCICAILRDKIFSFFQPSQFGVACKAVFKVDMSNAFNMVSRQAVMDQCATYFPELLPSVSWCYGSHTSLWHPMGQIRSQTGVQQDDPLGPMLFALVLHKLVTSIDADDDCLQLLLEAWYLDDGVLAGERSAVIRALHLIEDLVVKSSLLPNLDIIGAPIGDFVHCSRFIAEKCAMPKILLKALVDVSTVDLHEALSLLLTLNNASTSVGAAAYAAELRKHVVNDTRCQELGWTCIPLAVETYGNWGMEAQSVFTSLASLLAIAQAIPKPKMLGDI
ncbi:hypothetical protein EMCRGX_G018041 [Ephydatia muelleri]